MTLNLKTLLNPGSGEGIPAPYSCTPGLGSNYKWIDPDGALGNGPNYEICCSTIYADDCIIDCNDFSNPGGFWDQNPTFTYLDECTTAPRFVYRATNHLTIPPYDLNCTDETESHVVILTGTIVDQQRLTNLTTGTYSFNILAEYEALLGGNIYLSPCRGTPFIRYNGFVPYFPITCTLPSYFGVCGTYSQYSAQDFPVNTCGGYELFTVQFDFTPGSPNPACKGRYIFIIEQPGVDCFDNFTQLQTIMEFEFID